MDNVRMSRPTGAAKAPMPRRAPKNVRVVQRVPRRSQSSSPDADFSSASQQARKAKKCPNPECRGTDTAEDGGQVICTECGAVISDKQLTQDVQFGEAANGQAIVQGVHVGEGQETARPAPGSSRVMGGTASKEMAVGDARREMVRLAANPGWNVRQHDIDKAERVFKLAYNYGHTKGRDRTHICAVCLYIAVRQRPPSEGTLMLIDFADFVNVSVFYLGRLYTELCAELRLNHEATVYQIRPELLAHRFCEELGFGADTYKIATEAVSIIKRMNRDWLVRGRRPSGIVGAAVILAARMNNYRRTVRELVYTAKVCEYTITKRLDEFRCTPISKLTVSEVRRKDWDAAAPEPVGPPAMYPEAFSTKKRKKRKTLHDSPGEQADAISVSSIASSNPTRADSPDHSQSTTKRSGRNRSDSDRLAMPPPSRGQANIDPNLLRASSQALRDIGDTENADRLAQGTLRGIGIDDGGDADVEENTQQEGASKRRKKQPRPLPEPSAQVLADEEQLEADINAELQNEDMLAQTGPAHDDTSAAPLPPNPDEGEDRDGDVSMQDVIEDDDESEDLDRYFGFFHPSRPEYEEEDEELQSNMPADEQWTSYNHEDIQEKYKETIRHTKQLILKYPITSASLLDKVPSTENIPDEEFADDPDVEDMILTEEEVRVKEAFWISRYGKHLKERHLKKVQKLIDEENGNVRQPRKRHPKKPKPGDDSGYARDGEGKVGDGWVGALKATFEHRGSHKLNYQAIGKILDSAAPSTTSGRTSRAASVASSISLSRQGTPARPVRPVRMPRLPRNGKMPEDAAQRLAAAAPGKTVSAEGRRAASRSEMSAGDARTHSQPDDINDNDDDDDDGEDDDEEDNGDYLGPTGRQVTSNERGNAYDNEDDDEDDEDEDDDDGMPDMADIPEAVRNRMAAGMSYEEAVNAGMDIGF